MTPKGQFFLLFWQLQHDDNYLTCDSNNLLPARLPLHAATARWHLIPQFWNVEILLHFNLAFSQCSTSIHQAFTEWTKWYLRVFNFGIFILLSKFMPILCTWTIYIFWIDFCYLERKNTPYLWFKFCFKFLQPWFVIIYFTDTQLHIIDINLVPAGFVTAVKIIDKVNIGRYFNTCVLLW